MASDENFETDNVRNKVVELTKQGQHAEALNIIQNAMKTNSDIELINIKSAVLLHLKRFDEALYLLKNLVIALPERNDIKNNQSACFIGLGRFEEAITFLKSILDIDPSNSDAKSNLALALEGCGKLDEALSHVKQISTENADNVEVRLTGARIAMKLGNLREAEDFLNQVVKIDTQNAQAHFGLGNIYIRAGKQKEAALSFLRAVEFDENHKDAYNNLGLIFKDIRRYQEAEKCFLKALEIDKSYAPPAVNCAEMYAKSGKISKGILLLQEKLNDSEQSSFFHQKLSQLYTKIGKFELAVKHSDAAIQLRPEDHRAFSDRLFLSNYDHTLSPEQLYRKYNEFSNKFEMPIIKKLDLQKKTSVKMAGEKIRVAFMSGDFHQHVAMKFFLPILKNIDRNIFSIIGIATSNIRDNKTSEIEGLCDHFTNITALSDEIAAEKLKDIGIDILVDLSGHTGHNRLLLMAYRLAPVQITMLGYGYTTGMRSVDYFLFDQYSLGVESEKYISEKPLRLPRVFCMDPDLLSSDVSSSPFERNSLITFGSLSRLVRLNDDVISVWAKILLNSKNSRLILDQTDFKDPDIQEIFRNKFLRHGVSESRLVLRCSRPHILSYNDIDICLDPFPHGAGTTNYESLSMGVPYISMRGILPIHRIGSSLLSSLGLSQFIAMNEEEYLRIANRVCLHPQELVSLRRTMRNRLKECKIFDAVDYTKHFQQALISTLE